MEGILAGGRPVIDQLSLSTFHRMIVLTPSQIELVKDDDPGLWLANRYG
jgi:hypothetical protein